MTPKEIRHRPPIGLSAFVLLGLLLLLIYSNAFHTTWHLDDYNSIIGNERIHAEVSRPESVLKPFRSVFNSEPLNRPFAHFTLALNWYWGKDSPGGYILVNILIHVWAAFLLFRTFSVLFETPRMKGALDSSRVQFVSLLAAVLWAVNPVQVQAITYIVQRMASLCALFYLMGMYFYIRGRIARIDRWRWMNFAGCLVAFLLAFLSKENAATFPLVLVLIEAIFFQDLGDRLIRRRLLILGVIFTLLVIFSGLLLFFRGGLSDLLAGYEKRYFTLFERLLTQPRVLIYYLTLIFYPSPNRLSLVHDIQVSTSLWTPWSTLPGILCVIGLIGLSLLKLRKWLLFSFAVLFFFLAHVIESTVIPLELIFEHRNYLPSMFIFLPVAVGLDRLMEYYRSRSRMLYGALIAFIPLLIIGLGTSTYIRNSAWQTEKRLWEDALRKAPNSARPYINLAWAYYERKGDLKTALVLYHEALRKKHNRDSQYAKIYNNIANIYYQSGNCEQAVEYWKKSYEVSDSFYTPRYRLAMALTRCGRHDEALVHINGVLEQKPDLVMAIKLKGVILLLQDQPRKALMQFRKCIKLKSDPPSLYVNLGAGFVILGDHRKAELFLNRALEDSGRERLALLWSAVNSLHMNDTRRADLLLEELTAKMSIEELKLLLQKGFESRVYKSDIIFPDTDEELVNRLVSRYRQSMAGFEQLSRP
jgi:Flp pilus assembly protein TadD